MASGSGRGRSWRFAETVYQIGLRVKDMILATCVP